MMNLNHYYLNGNSTAAPYPIELSDPNTGARKVIIDKTGRFSEFPGIEKQAWIYSLKENFDFEAGMIEYLVEFQKTENGYDCYWTIQPDGRYYADASGYGIGNEEEIILKASLNEYGEFLGPFTCHRLGKTLWKSVEKKEQIQNIREMESRLDRSLELIHTMPASMEAFQAFLPEMKKLEDYYYSINWHIDRYDDAHGNLPKDLKRGILSEDAIYNMLCERAEKVRSCTTQS